MRSSLILLIILQVCWAREPGCSKFAYEESMLEKMVRTEISFEKLQEEFKTMSNNVHTIMNTVKEVLEDIKVEKRDLRGALEEMQTEKRNIRDEFQRLNSTSVSRLEEYITASKDAFQRETQQMSDKFHSKEKQIERISEDLRNMFSDLQKNLTESVGKDIVRFKAAGSMPLRSSNQTGIFSHVQTNIHDGYDSSTGIFTAPVSGRYLFTAQICSSFLRYFDFDIWVNGKQSGKESAESSDVRCETTEAFEYMEKGQVALVRTSTDRFPYRYIRLDDNSFFSGELIRKP